MTLVDATYVNHSGAKRLLEYFISYIHKRNELDNYYFILDSRLRSDYMSKLPITQTTILNPKESERRKFYKCLPNHILSIFCFANVPPPIEITGVQVLILQHNPFFFENPGFSLWDKIIYFVKRQYIKSKCAPHYYWIVQTPRIKDLLINALGVQSEKIMVKPFFEMTQCASLQITTQEELSFIYAADGVPQKNHIYLFKVWEKMFKEHSLNPTLHLTIPLNKVNLIKEVDRLSSLGINILNHGFIPSKELNNLYLQNRYLVFPSLSESFGLPLVEAAQFGLKVIGSDLPFLHQVVEPSAVFDPSSIDSLCSVITDISKGRKLKETRILVEDNIEELVRFINPNNIN